jgi:hypothetical protein
MSPKPRLGIHVRPGGFSDRWLEYCDEKRVPFIPVDCHSSHVLEQLRQVDGLLWHWLNGEPDDLQCAPRLIPAAERMGIHVFPNSATCRHYDDKIAQKYLLEAIEAPLIPTWVFYDLDAALAWIEHASFPSVFKLARGAGSQNVRLVRSAAEARTLARRAFGAGFPSWPGPFRDIQTRARKHMRSRDLARALGRLPRTLADIRYRRRVMPREKGYVLFQEFVPGNRFDTRITVIGDRAFGFTRDVRSGDFRASGSGAIVYDRARIDLACVRIAFGVTRQLGAQSLAFDFVRQGDRPLIAEISYTYLSEPVHRCSGYWTPELEWHEGYVWPEDAIIEDLLANLMGMGSE